MQRCSVRIETGCERIQLHAERKQPRQRRGFAIQGSQPQSDLLIRRAGLRRKAIDVAPSLEAQRCRQRQPGAALDQVLSRDEVVADEGLYRGAVDRRSRVDEHVEQFELPAVLSSDRRAHREVQR